MQDVIEVIVLTGMAGAAIPIGGVLARIERIQPRWLELEFRHAVVAFGGGILLAAVALALVPHGVQGLSLPVIIAAMGGGGITFCLLDAAIARARASAGQLVAMMSDFLPEALALGAAFATGESIGLLLALLITLQNLPEGFNAYRELTASSQFSRNTVLLAFVCLVPLGPAAGLIGYYWLGGYPDVINVIMLFAAGGILYLIFEDVAPQAILENRWAPPLGAVAGFLFGLTCQILVG